MPLVTNGRRHEVVSRGRGPNRAGSNTPTTALHLNMPGNKPRMFTMERGGPVAQQAMADMAAVREHYGLNISDALRISLHLTANAIRANKARPEVA